MKIIGIAVRSTLIGFLLACSIVGIDGNSPKYTGVDPRVSGIVNEWLSLSKLHGLKFRRPINVGFTDILNQDAVGQTRYEYGFTEIDIDQQYWTKCTATMKMTLVFHELTHGYCKRDHDYGQGLLYPETDYRNPKPGNSKIDAAGRFSDLCPLSLMFPNLITDTCMRTHFSDYTKEMFDRCQPY